MLRNIHREYSLPHHLNLTKFTKFNYLQEGKNNTILNILNKILTKLTKTISNNFPLNPCFSPYFAFSFSSFPFPSRLPFFQSLCFPFFLPFSLFLAKLIGWISLATNSICLTSLSAYSIDNCMSNLVEIVTHGCHFGLCDILSHFFFLFFFSIFEYYYFD